MRTKIEKLQSVVLGMCFVFLHQGCALWVDQLMRIGPTPNHDIEVGTPRAEVERILGKALRIETESDGQVTAVYEYTVREGGRELARGPDELIRGAVEYVSSGLVFFDPLFALAVYLGKDIVIYRIAYVYGPEGLVVSPLPLPAVVHRCSGVRWCRWTSTNAPDEPRQQHRVP